MLNTPFFNQPVSLALADWRLPVSGSEAVRFCAEHHIKALQMDFGGPGRSPSLNDLKRQEATLEACAKYGIHIIALAGNQLNDIGLGSKLNRYEVQKLKKLIISILDTAYYFSVPLVFFPSFHKGIIRDEATLMRTAKMLRWVCQEAKDRRLCLGNENDLSIVWAKRLAAEINADNFCFIFDSYNPIKAEISVSKLLNEMGDYFAPQVHIKDGFYGEVGHTMLGSGDGELTATLAILNQAGWVKNYVLENDYRDGNLARLKSDLTWITHYFITQNTIRDISC